MKMSDWRERLAAHIDATPGLNMKAVSLKAGLGETTVRDILKRGYTPTIDNFLAICEAAGRDPFYFLYGDNFDAQVQIPVRGAVCAGEGWDQVDDEPGRSIEFALEEGRSFGIEVRGNSMSPVYRHGDYLVCVENIGRNIDNLVGLDCAVLTEDGQGYVKILKRGTRPGRYNLKSYNPLFDDIENVQLKWAAPIIWVKRGR